MLKLIRLSFLLMVLFSTSSQAAGFQVVKYNKDLYAILLDGSEKTIADLKEKIAERLDIKVEDFDLYKCGGTTRVTDIKCNDVESIHETMLATRIIVRLRK